MPYTEDELLPISALQHLVFCQRQCALIHVEEIWRDNLLTAEGRELHTFVDDPGHRSRGSRRTVRSLRLASLKLGICGISDVVEFDAPEGAMASDLSGELWFLKEGALRKWTVTPVEYKRGSPKHNSCDAVQLCAQALCLEDMLDCTIERGSIFYGQERRRETIEFSGVLRKETTEACRRLHELIDSRILPKAVYTPACKNCSLIEDCMPRVTGGDNAISAYISAAINRNLED